MNKLPDEILEHIFTFLSGHDLTNSMKTCQRWRTIIASTPSIWKGDVEYKAVGKQYGPSCLMDALYQNKGVQFLDICEDYSSIWSNDQIEKLFKNIHDYQTNLRKIRFHDPHKMIPFIKGLMLLPKLQEIRIILYALLGRCERLSMIKQFLGVKGIYKAAFHNRLEFKWVRDLSQQFESQPTHSVYYWA